MIKEAMRRIASEPDDSDINQVREANAQVQYETWTPLAKQEQGEPVGWPCVIETADFEDDIVTLKMQSKDYSVGVGLHWLSTSLQQRTWVGLTDQDIRDTFSWGQGQSTMDLCRAIEAKLKEKNT